MHITAHQSTARTLHSLARLQSQRRQQHATDRNRSQSDELTCTFAVETVITDSLSCLAPGAKPPTGSANGSPLPPALAFALAPSASAGVLNPSSRAPTLGSANGSKTASALRLECAAPRAGTTTLAPVVLTIVSRMYGWFFLAPGSEGSEEEETEAASESSVGTGLMSIPLVLRDEVEIMLGKSSPRPALRLPLPLPFPFASALLYTFPPTPAARTLAPTAGPTYVIPGSACCALGCGTGGTTGANPGGSCGESGRIDGERSAAPPARYDSDEMPPPMNGPRAAARRRARMRSARKTRTPRSARPPMRPPTMAPVLAEEFDLSEGASA
ncbi:hypothetical protein OH77DRAFT_810115 [Trametes cingulata]|nr:hypothetical protein OH77DRAFT_810115 [Trametes cingulata]